MLDRRSLVKGSAVSATSCLMTLLLPVGVRAAPPRIKMRDLYNKDLTFSDFAKSHEGKIVVIDGFMAPPLKAESTFFVLTKMPLSVCPFCETEAEWPDDILAIYTRRVIEVVPFNKKIVVQGRLALGGFKDPETGFVSRVRIEHAKYERA